MVKMMIGFGDIKEMLIDLINRLRGQA